MEVAEELAHVLNSKRGRLVVNGFHSQDTYVQLVMCLKYVQYMTLKGCVHSQHPSVREDPQCSSSIHNRHNVINAGMNDTVCCKMFGTKTFHRLLPKWSGTKFHDGGPATYIDIAGLLTQLAGAEASKRASIDNQ